MNSDDESLDFQEMGSDEVVSEISRRAYRVPVKDRPGFILSRGDIHHHLVDISATGASFLVAADADIGPGDLLEDSELQLGEITLKDMLGVIMHRSLDEDEDWICGVQWLNLDAASSDQLEQLVQQLRKELFQ